MQTINTDQAIVANLASFPKMAVQAEALRERIRAYVTLMRQTKAEPKQIHLQGWQYDALLKSANTCRRKAERDAPPPHRSGVRGHSAGAPGEGEG